MQKLIITIAPTGNVPTRADNSSTPVTIDQIVADIKACREHGASVAHIHVRDEEEKPTCERSLYKAVLDRLKEEKSDIITQVSTGARGGGNALDWRGQMLDLGAEMASLSIGSSNFAHQVNSNSFELIEHLAKIMYDNNLKPELECFDLGMIDNARILLKRGIIKGPLHFNLVMNVYGSVSGTPRNLLHMVESLPDNSTFSVSGIGPSQIPMLTMAMVLGGHVRTGLEDTLLLRKGVPASNVTLIERVVKIANSIEREIATPNEAREILSLPLR